MRGPRGVGGGGGGPRGGPRPGNFRNQQPGGAGVKPKNTLKFDNDYDFEQANTEFAELRCVVVFFNEKSFFFLIYLNLIACYKLNVKKHLWTGYLKLKEQNELA